jgi:hypothetical protein
MNPGYEENKNCAMKISKNIKKKVYSSLKDNNNNNNNNNDNNNINYKYNNNNNGQGQNKNSNTNINFNTSKQKNKNNIKQKTNLDNEINLLNTFMDDFNKKEQKEVSYFANYKNISREIREVNTQRLPKTGNSKKNINSAINYNYNSEKFLNQKSRSKKREKMRNKEKREAKNEIFNKQNVDYFEKENYYVNVYQRKYKPYIISKETNNFIKKRMKNVNTDDYYSNDIKMGNNTNDSDSIKNIKFVTLKKDDKTGQNLKLYQKIIENEKIMNGGGKNNYSSNKI